MHEAVVREVREETVDVRPVELVVAYGSNVRRTGKFASITSWWISCAGSWEVSFDQAPMPPRPSGSRLRTSRGWT